MTLVLSHYQAETLLRAREKGQDAADVSPDLGLTTVEVQIKSEEVHFPGGQSLTWEDVQRIHDAESSCFLLDDASLQKAQVFSELTDRLYSLYPTPSAPTMLVSGIPMHRIKGTDPHRDTLEKIKAIQPVIGQVLDTATGLGYTAIEAARTAAHVTTIELDPAALKVARLNPWSQALFDNPKITQVVGDSFYEVVRFEDGKFTRIIHDPPAFSLAGDLYSGEIYRQLHRVLRNGGCLFHYIGNPESKSGRNITGSVIRRLQEAGFIQVRRAARAFGVVAYK